MSQGKSAVAEKEPVSDGHVDELDDAGRSGSGAGDAGRVATAPSGGGLFRQYKAEQGKNTRVGSFIGIGVLIAWGAVYLHDYLSVFEGDEAWRLLITTGIPIFFAAVLGALAWWFVFGNRSVGDFMIATEGEMKKVNWSTRKEIIGSTKVVILFTVLMAVLLFVVDLLFQALFVWVGVLKK